MDHQPLQPDAVTPGETSKGSGTAVQPGMRPGSLAQFKLLGILTLVLAACFGKPLYHLIQFAMSSQFYSHLPMVPFISAYFVWMNKHEIPAGGSPRRAWAIVPAIIGGLLLAAFWMLSSAHAKLSIADALALQISSFLMFFGAATLFCLPTSVLRPLSFPLGMLAFMIPFPDAMTNALETFFQHTSAYAAAAMFTVTGTDMILDDLVIKLPGITLQVAPECSGIRSSLVLFITSFIAGKMFLKSTTHRALLSVFVIPLAILRNGFRIFTIGMLCVHVSPDMIHSPIHHKGGPIFFALSLVPFFAVLWYLRRRERSAKHLNT
jgi:exosortase C (VPDSG-CTERM-specific)